MEDELLEEYEVNKIKADASIHPTVKASRIIEAKKSFSQRKTNSSIKTIFSITNTMVGSSMVVFPLIFLQSGIITSFIVLIIIGAISCKTAQLEIVHFKSQMECDFPEVIKRVLGKKWELAYVVSSVLLLYVVGVVYFLLCCNMIYPCLEFFASKGDSVIAKQTELTFSKFSFQWTGLILIVCSFFLFCIKKIDLILKFGQYGIYAVIIFFFYVIVRGIMNISEGKVDSDIKLVDSDIGNLTGVLALSFFIHNVLLPILKKNKNPENNTRDLVLGYIMTGLIYLTVGVFGCLAAYGNKPFRDPVTFFDYIEPNYDTAIVQILLFLQLLTVLPILWYIARTQFFNLFYQNREAPLWQFYLSNVVFAACCLAVVIGNLDPSLIISIDGAICGYLLIYVIPIKIHMACLYDEKVKGSLHQGLLSAYGGVINERRTNENTFVSKFEGVEVENLQFQPATNSMLDNKCQGSHNTMIQRVPKSGRITFYLTIALIGTAILVYKIYVLAKGK